MPASIETKNDRRTAPEIAVSEAGAEELSGAKKPAADIPVGWRGWREGARNFVATVLLVTGAMKLMSFGPVLDWGSLDWGSIPKSDSAGWWFGLGVLEIGLASWLFSRWRVHTGNVVTLLFFTGALLFSTAGWFAGKSTCPCLGNFELPLFYSLAFSGIAALFFAVTVFHPALPSTGVGNCDRAAGNWIACGLGGGLMLTASFLWASSNDLLPRLLEQRLLATHQSPILQINFAEDCEFEVQVLLRNHSRTGSRAINGCQEKSCFARCLSSDLPLVLAPGEERFITLKIFRDVGGVFSDASWQLFVDQVNQQSLPVNITEPFTFQLEFITGRPREPVPLAIWCEARTDFLQALRARGGAVLTATAPPPR